MASAAWDLQYQSRYPVNGSLAYDLDYEIRERELRHAGEAPRRQEAVKEQPRVRTEAQPLVRERQRLSLLTAVGFAAVVAMAVMVLSSYIQLMVLSSGTVELKKQLTALEAEHVSLTAQYEQLFDRATVKEAAEAAGMAKPRASQVYYIDLSSGDSAVVYQTEEPSVLSRLLTSLNHGVYAVVEYFD